jgi:hypothetical protein
VPTLPLPPTTLPTTPADPEGRGGGMADLGVTKEATLGVAPGTRPDEVWEETSDFARRWGAMSGVTPGDNSLLLSGSLTPEAVESPR